MHQNLGYRGLGRAKSSLDTLPLYMIYYNKIFKAG
jgi:hypothetical protein